VGDGSNLAALNIFCSVVSCRGALPPSGTNRHAVGVAQVEDVRAHVVVGRRFGLLTCAVEELPHRQQVAFLGAGAEVALPHALAHSS